MDQQTILRMLSSKGINITQQTLRNWEKDSLITPPVRGSGYGGRWSNYIEYSLYECYATHMMISGVTKGSVPKFPVPMIAKVRGSFVCNKDDNGTRANYLREYLNSGAIDNKDLYDLTIMLSIELLWAKYILEAINLFYSDDAEYCGA